MNKFAKKIGYFILDTIQTIVLALSFFVICYLFLFQPHQVKGTSMFPNFHDGEFLLTEKVSYRFNPPKRGDVIVFKAPPSEPCAERECEYIKRIIGTPGDFVMVANDDIYINNQRLPEDYLPQGVQTRDGSFLQEGKTIQLREDEYLACGDNRPHSRDGREFGPIKRTAIIGKAWIRYWPVSRLGLVK